MTAFLCQAVTGEGRPCSKKKSRGKFCKMHWKIENHKIADAKPESNAGAGWKSEGRNPRHDEREE